jgi:hypothetical protein
VEVELVIDVGFLSLDLTDLRARPSPGRIVPAAGIAAVLVPRLVAR